MTELVEETEFAIENLDVSSYRDEVSEMETELHKLREELAEVEKSVLQDRGYKPVNIEDTTVMVPVGMSMEQLYTSLQQMPPPNENSNRAMKNLVSDEDKEAVRESDKYEEVVERRRKLIQRIRNVYQDFWDDQVNPNAENEIQKISYMLAGLDRDIRSHKLSEITGIPTHRCKRFSLVDGIVHMEA